jgi:GNAT superfamily N-acetyltransferase
MRTETLSIDLIERAPRLSSGRIQFRCVAPNDPALPGSVRQFLAGASPPSSAAWWEEATSYDAAVFLDGSETVGYALFKEDQVSVRLRALFVDEPYRRRGIASAALVWLDSNVWRCARRLRVYAAADSASRAFWAAGQRDYPISIETRY